MTARLLACRACSRHVRVHEAQCPFCSAAIPDLFASTPGRLPPPPGLTRDELFRYGRTAATVSAGVLATTVALGSCGEGIALSYGFACCCMDGGNPGSCPADQDDASFHVRDSRPPNLLTDGAAGDARRADGGDGETEAASDANDAASDSPIDGSKDTGPD
jgi:hypothetical protein